MSAFDLKLDAKDKAKLQSFISSKLAKISSYTDDVLPEYVMVMIQNKKTASQVSLDLNAFLGKDAVSFTEWLWEAINNYIKGTLIIPESIAQKEKEVDRDQKMDDIPEENSEPSKEQVPSDSKTRKLSSVIASSNNEYRDQRRSHRFKEDRDRNERKSWNKDRMNERERDRSRTSEREWDRGKEREWGETDKRDSKSNKGRGERKYNPEEEVENTKTSAPNVHSVIATNQEITSPRPARDLEISSKLVMNAVKQAAEDTKTNPSRLSSPSQGIKVIKKTSETEPIVTITLNDGITKKRGSWEDRNIEKEEEKSKKAKPAKCQYWPNCKRGNECNFHHPKERCKNYPNCSFGDQCLYIHPLSNVPCKYGSKCTNPECTFIHPPPTASIPCKDGFFCYLWNGNCPYMHPMEACKFGPKCTKGAACPYSHEELCKFGARCIRPGCSFAHITVTTKPVRFDQTLCKFGSSCKNDGCTFEHPEGRNNVDVSKLSESLPQTPPRKD